VLLGYASALGQALLARERSRPHAWIDERERCRQAGLPADRPLAPKPQRARPLRARACAAGVPAAWVTGDRVDGHDRPLRLWLEGRSPPSVHAGSGQESGWVGAPQRQVHTILARLPVAGGTRLSAGDGAPGPRWDAWRWLPLAAPREPGWCRWWLVRRRRNDPPALTASSVLAPQATPLAAVVQVAGSRWTIARGVEAAKGEVGLDPEDVRTWTGGSRHSTLARWALALLTRMRAGPMAVEACKKRLRPRLSSRPLAACKAGRGLASRCASPRGVGCWAGGLVRAADGPSHPALVAMASVAPGPRPILP
jgi:hypothetical protein